jgi:uncharacterized protein YgbK (DUF1537 family)
MDVTPRDVFPPLECLLLADDLTGACDAAVHFAVRGHPTAAAVSLDSARRDARVWSVNTESRDLGPAAIEWLMEQARASLPVGPATLIFKKIDSTLRGNAGMETAAALKAFGCDLAVFTPALPALGRTVEGGCLCVAAGVAASATFAPIELAGWLRAQGVERSTHVRSGGIEEAMARGARVVSCDASSDGDLDRMVAEALALGRRILWAGSAGLAAALARALPGGHAASPAAPRTRGPVLFGVGSNHPATLAQRHALAGARRLTRTSCARASAVGIARALKRGRHVWLDIPRGQVGEETLRGLLAGLPAAALALSGGDTASLVCRALGVERIDLQDEIVPGIPRGALGGGDLDGMAVATKSGGFGAPDAFTRVADFFACTSGEPHPGSTGSTGSL